MALSQLVGAEALKSEVFPHLGVLENVRAALHRKLGTSFHLFKSERSLDGLCGRSLGTAITHCCDRWWVAQSTKISTVLR